MIQLKKKKKNFSNGRIISCDIEPNFNFLKYISIINYQFIENIVD